MKFYEVEPVAIIGDKETLTYAFDGKLVAGQIVMVTVGRKSCLAVVRREVAKPSFACKEITQVLDFILPGVLLKLKDWLAVYYICSAGTVWGTMLPAGLDKKRRSRQSAVEPAVKRKAKLFELNTEQKKAVAKIWETESTTFLLRGITGSGKTAVYKELAKRTISAGRSVIILVPEISLTSQLVAEFRDVLPNVVLFHSTQTPAERAAVWEKVLRATEPLVVVGPRSALFLPLKNLGLIVVDECHEPSYKQDRSPKYNTLRVASVLGKMCEAKVVLGSATPSVVDYYLATKNDAVIEMNKRATGKVREAKRTIIDMTLPENRGKALSTVLIKKIEKVLTDKGQVLIFHNRRGTASAILCKECGWQAMCNRCFVPMTLHSDIFNLRCHACGKQDKVKTSCPACGGIDVVYKGLGTKKLEEELRNIFPNAAIARFDGDSKKGERANDFYQKMYNGEVDIIVGTQTIAKGLDLPKLRLVGIPQADSGLALPDFSTRERVFQLVSQAVGRVGRNESETEVVVQSFHIDDPAVLAGIGQDFLGFYNEELALRQRGFFPPFSYLLKAVNSYKTESAAAKAAQKLVRDLAYILDGVKVLGPTPAFYERERDNWHWQVVFRAGSRKKLLAVAERIPRAKWQVDIDPVSLL